MENLGQEEWKALDSMRSMLARQAPVILILSEHAVDTMASSAPNLFSWAAGGVFELAMDDEPQISSDDREQRLSELRVATGLNDGEIIQRAEDGILSREPEFAEWLVLLGRGDLIDR